MVLLIMVRFGFVCLLLLFVIVIVIVVIAVAGHDADTCLGTITAATTAAVADVAVNDAIAIAGAAVVAGDAGIEEADPVAAVADNSFIFLAHAVVSIHMESHGV